MIRLIDREAVFYKSSLVDHEISELQKSWYKPLGHELAGYIDEASIQGVDLYDHLEPFHHDKVVVDDFAVLGYMEKNREDYLTHRSKAFIRFYDLMGVERLYLLDELKCDWVQFPFRSREKRQAMEDMVGQAAYHEAFEFDIDDLSVILPLFNYSGRHSTAIIWLFSANSEVALAMFLCDDANFHTSFPAKDREKISAAAAAAGLVMGGLEVCRI
jgi:hypothetical protein